MGSECSQKLVGLKRCEIAIIILDVACRIHRRTMMALPDNVRNKDEACD